jgi:ADP-dependent NAD(P)H-hydrate dehydratase / NAD(P)H-hydrate epimerase
MRPIITPAQMRELDRKTIEVAGLPGIVLMELAARGVYLEIENIMRGNVDGSRIAVFCGGGNNGGDGFAVARRLMNAGSEVFLFLLADRDKIQGDALTNMKVYENIGGKIIQIEEKSDLTKIPIVDIIVDALLGTGLVGAPKGVMADTIEAINTMHAPVVSVDIPSGIDGTTGYAAGAAIKADITTTFGEIKVGHIIEPGLENCGRISKVDIQIPKDYIKDVDIPLFLVEPQDVYEMLPQRPLNAHKGDAGKVLVIAGSVGMTGAAELASMACLRSGAGLVKVATAKDAQAVLASRNAEIMTIPVADTDTGSIAPEAETTIKEASDWADVEVIGPGLSLNPDTVKWFEEHVKEISKPTVIDADGLNALAQLPERLANLDGDIVLTPHLGEFARLTGLSSDDIAKDRVELVRKYANEWNVTVLLKGFPTLVASPKTPVFGIIAGNPGMATAGMGDVLTGVIAGLMGQGMSGRDAAVAATTIHGLAGNLSADQVGNRGLVAGDIVERLPLAQDIVAGRAQYPQSSGGCGSGGGGCGGGCGDDGGDCGCDGDCGDGGHGGHGGGCG